MSKTAIDLHSHYYPKPLVKKLMDYGILNEDGAVENVYIGKFHITICG